MNLIVYGLIALAILGGVSGLVYEERKAGGDKVRAELAPKLAAAEQALAQVKAEGEKAAKEAAEKKAQDDKRKKDADNELSKAKRDLAGLYDAYGRLRDQRLHSGGSLLPASPSGSPSPQSITLNRAALDRGVAEADGILQSGAEKILRRGDEAIADLDNAKRWAQR